MKNIVCPVSGEKIPENLPRVTALFVVSLFGTFLITGYLPVILFLTYDFFVRGFNYSKYSLIHLAAKNVLRIAGKGSKLIDKAPKLFAARLGFVMCILITVFSILNIEIASNTLVILILFLSFLESFFGVCVGCILFSWIVLPIYQRRNNFDPTI
jgi:hypothetical protein